MRRILLLLVLIALAVSVPALEVSEGSVRLTLDEDTSRFLVDLQMADGSYLPLIFAEDSRTSGLDIREDNMIYRMGDSGDFRQVAEQTDEGIFYVWTSATLRVSQRFRFIRSVGGSDIDGVQIDVSITNLGEQTVPVAMRLLLDTYLGEGGNAHFSTPIAREITRETAIDPSSRQSYVRSAAEAYGDGFQVMIYDAAVSTPTQIALANWRRLAASDWDYVVNEDRNFNRLPYSINDSAILLSYEEKTLAQNERYQVTVQLGGPAPDGYLDPGTSATPVQDTRALLLVELTEIINEIDALISNPDATAEQVRALRERLDALAEQVPGQ